VSSRVDQHEARKENLIKKANDHCKLLHRYQSSYGTLMCADKNKTYCVDNAVEEGKRNWLEHNPPVKFLRTNLKKFISNWSMIFSTLATLNLQILMFSHIFAMFMWLASTQQKFAFVQGCCHACFHQQLILSLIFFKVCGRAQRLRSTLRYGTKTRPAAAWKSEATVDRFIWTA